MEAVHVSLNILLDRFKSSIGVIRPVSLRLRPFEVVLHDALSDSNKRA